MSSSSRRWVAGKRRLIMERRKRKLIEDNTQLFLLMREAGVTALQNFAISKLRLDRSAADWEVDLPARIRHICRQIGIEESYWPEVLR